MALIHAEPRRFTVDEYFRLYEQGVIPPDERTELLEGVIVPRMSQNPPHVASIILATEQFMKTLGDTHHVGVQVTARLTRWSAPDPDFVLLPRSGWQPGQPITTADLVVEVADTSLPLDRYEKGSLYALASLVEYWIIDVAHRRVEMYRDPIAMPDTAYGAGYASVKTVGEDSSVSPLCRPDVSIRVAHLLPPPSVSEQP